MQKILLVMSADAPQLAAEELFVYMNQESISMRDQASMSENIIQAFSKIYNFSWQNNRDFPEDQKALSYYFLKNLEYFDKTDETTQLNTTEENERKLLVYSVFQAIRDDNIIKAKQLLKETNIKVNIELLIAAVNTDIIDDQDEMIRQNIDLNTLSTDGNSALKIMQGYGIPNCIECLEQKIALQQKLLLHETNNAELTGCFIDSNDCNQ